MKVVGRQLTEIIMGPDGAAGSRGGCSGAPHDDASQRRVRSVIKPSLMSMAAVAVSVVCGIGVSQYCEVGGGECVEGGQRGVPPFTPSFGSFC